jgi:hypothetical protein
MRKVAFSLPVLAAALVAGCGSIEEKATPAPVVVTPPAPVVTVPPTVVVPQASAPAVVVPTAVSLRAGRGRIESIAAIPPSAAAGGSSTSQRIGVKMDDGTMQFLDTSAPNLAIGDRIEITAEGNIRR